MVLDYNVLNTHILSMVLDYNAQNTPHTVNGIGIQCTKQPTYCQWYWTTMHKRTHILSMVLDYNAQNNPHTVNSIGQQYIKHDILSMVLDYNAQKWGRDIHYIFMLPRPLPRDHIFQTIQIFKTITHFSKQTINNQQFSKTIYMHVLVLRPCFFSGF